MAFRYKACLTLDRLVGQQTAVIAISEAAALEFLYKAGQQPNQDAYISERCSEHGILVTGSYIPMYRERRHRYYVAQTYEWIDFFRSEFKREYEEYFGSGTWVTQSSTQRNEEGADTPLLEILRNIPNGSSLKSHPYFSAVDYYRLMRNCIVHSVASDEVDRRLRKDLPKLQCKLAELYKKETPKEYRFNAPNSLHALQLDDVRLFARCMQRLARKISDLARPPDQILVNAVFEGEGGTSFLRSFKKKTTDKSDSVKVGKKLVRLRLMSKHGFTSDEATEIVSNCSLPIVPIA